MKVNKQKLLLLVEDNVLIATSGQIDLEQYGYKIILAHSGEEAVELFKTNPNIDLIIMDIDLGEGIDGIEAAEIILREREIPILFLSSHIEPEIVEKTENITSYGYVVKNSSITVLDASIKMAFKLFDAKMNELIKEKKLEKSEEKLRNIFENSTSLFYSFTPEHVVTYLSPQVKDILGYTPEEAMIKWTELASDNPINEVGYNYTVKAIETGKPQPAYELELVKKDGTKIWVELREGPVVKNGKTVAIVGTLTDITDRKKAMTELQESEEKYRLLTESMKDVVIRISPAGKLLYVSPTIKEFGGYEPKEEIGNNISNYFYKKTDLLKALKLIADVVISHKSGSFEFMFKPKGKDPFFVEHTYVPLINDNKVYEIQLVLRNISDRKKIERQLQKSEENLRITLTSIGDAVISTDINGQVVQMNPIAEQLTGWTIKEAKGELLLDVFHIINTKTRKIVDNPAEKVLKSGQIVGLANHTMLISKDGTEYQIADSGAPIKDNQGNITGVVLVFRDVTEEYKMQEDLKRSEQYFKTLIENSSDVISILDKTGAVTYESPSHKRILGYDTDFLIEKNIFALVHPDDRERILHQFVELLPKPGSVEQVSFRFLHKNGNWLNLEGIANNLLHSPIINGIIVNYRDVTDRKKAEEKLYESENNLRLLFNAMEDIVLEMDDKGKYIYIAPTSSELYYKPAKEAIGKTLHEVFPKHQADYFVSNIKKSLKENETVKIEYELKIKDKIIYFEGRFAPKSNNTVLYIASNITERKQAEQKVKNLLKEKEILLKEVHHRTKNNMTVIKSLLSMQIRSLKIPEAVSCFLDAISRIESMIKLYDKLYKTENYEEVTIKTYLYSLIDEIIQLFPNWKSIQINKQIEDFAIETKLIFPLGIILTELLTNTMKYAFPNKKDGKIDVNISKKQNHVTFIYKDNGIGIIDNKKEEQKPGFGLNLIKLLSKQINGSVINTNDNGVKFIIEFDI